MCPQSVPIVSFVPITLLDTTVGLLCVGSINYCLQYYKGENRSDIPGYNRSLDF